MRHRMAGRKLGRSSSHRRALMRTMVTEFLENERMVTTISKAKEVRSVAEKMITLGKKEHLHARRQALSFLRKKSVVFKLFDSLGPRFADRHGGYTRILRLGRRPGDAAEMAVLELVEEGSEAAAKAEPKKEKKAKKPAPEKPARAASKDSKPRERKKSTKAKSSAKTKEPARKTQAAPPKKASKG